MKITRQQYSPYWDNITGPRYVDTDQRFYSDGEQVTDPEIWGVAFAIGGLACDVYWHSTDLARDLLQAMGESKQLRMTATIEVRHDAYLEDNRMAVKLEIEIEEERGE